MLKKPQPDKEALVLKPHFKFILRKKDTVYIKVTVPERVDKVDTLQAESSLSELSFENKGFCSRGAHRASPCRERFLRYTPAKTAFFMSEGIAPLTTPQILEFSVFRQSEAPYT